MVVVCKKGFFDVNATFLKRFMRKKPAEPTSKLLLYQKGFVIIRLKVCQRDSVECAWEL